MATILNSYSLAGGDTTSSVFTYSGSARNLDIEILTASISGGSTRVLIETSADNILFILVPGSETQLSKGSDSYVYHITESEGAYVRAKVYANDSRTGTITINATEQTSGSGGTQTLNQTLVLGNTTGGEDISISNGDKIVLDNGSELRVGTYDFGGTGGISRICSVGYEDMWQSGIHHIFDNNGFIRESNNCLAINPDNTFDNTLRFKVGSRWVLDDGTTYMCTDASTGAAVWQTIAYDVFGAAAAAESNANTYTDTALTGKMDTVPSATNENIGTFHGGQMQDSNISINNIGTSGSYIPTPSASVNLDSAPTMQTAMWMRIGDIVIVNGLFSANPTLAATTTSFEIDLPVASDLGLSEDLSGVAASGEIAGMSGNVIGDEATNTAKIQWKSTDITSKNWTFNFMYKVY
ncbi:hypothetical protein UFOVP1015_32 [uncultured Caudovirales phage]|uniref:Uncharacterized protein n=1 Tax=uncultured Caudovirales phage TaxID=2100421 RepID=A0A6J7XIN0_9CAUD|nr:hypothetical protein UFOVP1015_32 [uncultured Caudovirales phage]CAB5229219.1 hypothetical protein UFOVP1551_13 [uncultured Caudovirales phage]